MNSSQSRFATLPAEVDIPRSKWAFEHRHTTSFNAAELVPILMFPVIAGDTIKCNIRSFIRMSTPIHPVMDDAFADLYSFFVPHRLVWDHFEEFMGAVNTQPWVEDVEYTIPQVTAPEGGWQPGSIADHLGLPLGVTGTSVTALPFRSIAQIWNDWFRDVNLQNPAVYSKGDATTSGSNGSDYVMDIQGGGACPPVAKYHDYFTSALPSPQRGDPVSLAADLLDIGLKPSSTYSALRLNFYDNYRGLREGVLSLDTDGHVIAVPPQTWLEPLKGTGVGTADPGEQTYAIYRGGITTDGEGSFNLTVSDLRLALQSQIILEKDARGGGRFTDILKSHFGVTNPDFRLQRAEFIGSQHFAINMSQVLQTSETTDNSPQGNTAAFSATGHYGDGFLYSATEPGYIFTFVCIRNKQSYQQGLAREWTKKRRLEFYYPELNSIGEQAIYNRELFYSANPNVDGQIFGYQERFAEYRYHPDLVTGELRSTYPQSLDVWHYADYYTSTPVLSDGWIRATKNNIDRTLAVRSDVVSQFIGQFGFDFDVVRPMPLYSTPGVGLHF